MKTRESHRIAGFSLVEVTLSLGIVAFGLITLLGLLPTGLNLVKESADETTAASIARAISADLRSMESTAGSSAIHQIPVGTANSGKAYFNAEGKWLGNGGPYDDAVYTASWTIAARSTQAPPLASIVVTWPSRATVPSGSLDALVILAQNPN